MDKITLTPGQTESLQAILTRTAEIIIEKQGWNRSCVSCIHYNHTDEACTFYNPAMKPPARVIVTGCAAWVTGPF